MTGVTPEKARIQSASFHEAQRLGHHWVGPEHGLLAILRGNAEDVARRVLEEVGLTAAMVERHLEGKHRRSKDGEPARGSVTNPAWHHAYGRALPIEIDCALGFGVCALVRGGGPRDPGLPSLAADFGEEGGWMERLREDGVISPDHTA